MDRKKINKYGDESESESMHYTSEKGGDNNSQKKKKGEECSLLNILREKNI